VRRTSTFAALALLAGACTDSPAAGPEADAGVADPCDERLLDAPPWSLHRCSDGSSFSFRFNGLPRVEQATVGVVVAGIDETANRWPEAIWTRSGTGYRVRFLGRPGLPALTLTLALDGHPEVTLAVDLPADASGLVQLDGLLLLQAEVPGPPLEAVLPASEGRYLEGFVVRTGPEAAERALLVHGLGTSAATIRWSPTPQGVVARSLNAVSLAPGDTLTATPLQLYDGPDVFALLDEAARTLPPRPPSPLGWGWRSGGAYGALVSASALAREVEALRALAAARGHTEPPTVLVEGLWFKALGDWQGGEGFPEGLAAGLTALGEVQVGLRWPAGRAGPGSLPPEAEGAHLDFSLPAVQDQVGRDALELAAAGADWLALDEDFSEEERQLAGQARALTVFPGEVLASHVGGAVHLDGFALGAPLVAAEDACSAEAAGQWPRSSACGAALADPQPQAVSAPPTELMAAQRATWGHLGAHRLVDCGGVQLAGAEGEARISAVLAAAGGGPYLMADAPSRLTGAQADLFFAVYDLGLAGLHARGALGADPPARWESADAVALINWQATPQTLQLPDRRDLAGAPRRLTEGAAFEPGGTVQVPPRDVVVFRRVVLEPGRPE